MIDFTKEELQELISLIHGDDYAVLTIEELAKLAGKIQSMIDNYCEHEPDDFCYYRSKKKIRYTENVHLVPKDAPSFFKCKKCWEFF